MGTGKIMFGAFVAFCVLMAGIAATNGASNVQSDFVTVTNEHASVTDVWVREAEERTKQEQLRQQANVDIAVAEAKAQAEEQVQRTKREIEQSRIFWENFPLVALIVAIAVTVITLCIVIIVYIRTWSNRRVVVHYSPGPTQRTALTGNGDVRVLPPAQGNSKALVRRNN